VEDVREVEGAANNVGIAREGSHEAGGVTTDEGGDEVSNVAERTEMNTSANAADVINTATNAADINTAAINASKNTSTNAAVLNTATITGSTANNTNNATTTTTTTPSPTPDWTKIRLFPSAKIHIQAISEVAIGRRKLEEFLP